MNDSRGETVTDIASMSDERLVEHLTKVVHPRTEKLLSAHVQEHRARFKRVLRLLQPDGQSLSLLDIGGTGNLLHLYLGVLNYGFVAMANKWRGDSLNPEFLAEHIPADRFRCDYFDAETDAFPYAEETFDAVVCSEVIEHLKYDPGHMLAEINRVLKPEGKLVLTTPNITSFTALYRVMSGMHPQTWSVFTGQDADRHNREYTPREIGRLLEACGFGDIALETFSLQSNPLRVKLAAAWIALPWVVRGQFDVCRNRGDYISAACRKKVRAQNPSPSWLYDGQT